MHGWETRMLLKYYLERGVSKAELSRRFGVSRRTIHEWVETGQLDRDLSSGGSRTVSYRVCRTGLRVRAFCLCADTLARQPRSEGEGASSGAC